MITQSEAEERAKRIIQRTGFTEYMDCLMVKTDPNSRLVVVVLQFKEEIEVPQTENDKD